MKKFLLIILITLPTMAYGGKFDDKIYLKLSMDNTKQYLPEIGIGYYFSDFYRIDLASNRFKICSNEKYKLYDEIVDDSSISGTKRFNYKMRSSYFILSNYLDIIGNDYFKVFITGGVGVAQIKEKATHLFSGMMINGHIITVPLSVEHYRSKRTQNFIYSLGAGKSVKINPKISLDLVYRYIDFGKPKYKKEDVAFIHSIKRYKVHSFAIGMRFDL